MINRRQIVRAAAAGIAMFARVPNVRAAAYDLLIKGGRVINPSVGLDAVRDVAITGGRIVAVEPDIAGDGTETIDARGRIVAPGLIDIHTHVGGRAESAALVLQDGVTGFVDAGGGGPDTIDPIAAAMRAAPQIGRALVNVATRTGFAGPLSGELLDISRADVALVRAAIARNRDVVVGVKARLSHYSAGNNAIEGLRRAQEAASAFNLPVMVHIGQSLSPLREILALLKRGDIVTHMYAPSPNSALDDQGRLIPEVAQARSRGVIFDFGNGNGAVRHFSWEMIERATRQGFLPDTLSTDWNAMSRTTGVVDFPNVMSKFLTFGMPIAQVIACATLNAARVFPAFADRGTLNVGAPADVAIMELREGTFQFEDNEKGMRPGRQRLFPMATVINGKRAGRVG
jgi:dihydroorotase